MWYFAWILGLSMAVMFSILNAMWLDVHMKEEALNQENVKQLLGWTLQIISRRLKRMPLFIDIYEENYLGQKNRQETL